jgi:hypothetical protein
VAAQKGLVTVLGKFDPKLVKVAPSPTFSTRSEIKIFSGSEGEKAS